MSLDTFTVSAKAIEGFRRHEYANRLRRRLQIINGMGPAVINALLRLSENPRGLLLIGFRFGLPDDPHGRPRISREIARRLHRARYVRFASCMDGTWLELTAAGKVKAGALREAGK